jgi:uncharacterized protein YndB with AHSA1/START domain
MTSTSDRIEKKVLLRAPLDRVWRAVSDAREFGAWFGVELDGPFEAGKRLTGRITPTKTDSAVAKSQEPYAGMRFDMVVDAIRPKHHFAFKWHPFAIDPTVDYSHEPMTLVVFSLEETEGGTHLTITESGFDGIPLERRAKAFAMNDQGWSAQAELVAKYLAHAQ